ncbi:MAG: 8-oxo-dGTP diphosphatase [Candidatus Riflebacteria bacterium]|nr:8-oxo-dGTP diphosphatase [Candidatus Riflebacteria bacterium]
MKLATLCYLKQNGKTLFLFRGKRENDIHLGKWNGLGGKFEPGESPEECAKREILEESGYQAEKLILKGFITFPKFAKNEDWYVFVFKVTEFSGEMLNSKDIPEGTLEWIDDSRISALPMWEGDSIFLQWLDKPGQFSGKFCYENGKLISHESAFYN